jgi:hypothetical protein
LRGNWECRAGRYITGSAKGKSRDSNFLAVTIEFHSASWTEYAEGPKVAKRPQGKQPLVIVEIIYATIPQYEERFRKVMDLLLCPRIAQEANMEQKARKARGLR